MPTTGSSSTNGRNAVAEAIQHAEKVLPAGPESQQIRRIRKAIATVDRAHEAYYSKLDKRARSRRARLDADNAKRMAEADRFVQSSRAAHAKAKGGPSDLETFTKTTLREAEGWAALQAKLLQSAMEADSHQSKIEKQLQEWGDRIVIAAIESTHRDDGVENFRAALAFGVASGAASAAFSPLLAIPAAVVALSQAVMDLAKRLSRKRQLKDVDCKWPVSKLPRNF